MQKKYFDRELSWLSFNYRVLQEAINKEVPLIERLRFLAIYSSNLDEFYRVRVASYVHLLKVQKQQGIEQDVYTKKLLRKIKKTVNKQQIEFGKIFNTKLLPKLKAKGIHILNDTEVTPEQITYLKKYFNKNILPLLTPTDLRKKDSFFLKNKALYLVIVGDNNELYISNLPVRKAGRFITIPSDNEGQEYFIQLADVIRLFVSDFIPNINNITCYEVKLTRDAELYLEEEMAETVAEKISLSLYKRKIGDPSRFLYDETIPKELLKTIRKKAGIKKVELIPGGRYHNFNDFFELPVQNTKNLVYNPLPTLEHNVLNQHTNYFNLIAKKDVVLHFPYQDYSYVVKLLEQAATDDAVTEINITLYRVAKKSKVCKALILAAKNGKKVTVFNEVKARFDEELNIVWGDRMKAKGVNVLYSFEKLKVHSKICLITRKEGRKNVNYAYFGTGNFNEKTANIYCDHALLTKNTELTTELKKVFQFLNGKIKHPTFKHLLVAPFNMREQFLALIDNEITIARNGGKGKITIKLNSLEDKKMISKLYDASNAGVKITIIVRGICCLIPGVEGMSKNIKVISIIDRYLEHGRIYIFNNNGDEKMYLASADWMKRNLSSRVEVGFPILDNGRKREIKRLINLQLKDNVRARKLNITQSNPYKKSTAKTKVRAQYDFYNYLKTKVQ